MRIADSVALVTGAGRGLGRAYVQELAERGAVTIYAGARDPSQVTGPGIPVPLDVTDPDQVAAAARRCADVTLLVNNAGVMMLSPLIGAATMDGARLEIETNYLGTLAMCRAFAPILAGNGGGAIVNMLSVVSCFTNPVNGSYCASKAADLVPDQWCPDRAGHTRGPGGRRARRFHRHRDGPELAGDAPKISPGDVARQVFDAIETGAVEVLADERTRRIKSLCRTTTRRSTPRCRPRGTPGLLIRSSRTTVTRLPCSSRSTRGSRWRPAAYAGRPPAP